MTAFAAQHDGAAPGEPDRLTRHAGPAQRWSGLLRTRSLAAMGQPHGRLDVPADDQTLARDGGFLLWTTEPPDRALLARRGFQVVEYAEARGRFFVPALIAGTSRKTLDNPAQPWLDLLDEHPRIAVVGRAAADPGRPARRSRPDRRAVLPPRPCARPAHRPAPRRGRRGDGRRPALRIPVDTPAPRPRRRPLRARGAG